ncbi:hypothetical protein PSAB6_50115 [Paraburkholderia sabiae]|nr:hypothetical protein PSAB6_50115 [Paraburkholderia sabiae]
MQASGGKLSAFDLCTSTTRDEGATGWEGRRVKRRHLQDRGCPNIETLCLRSTWWS